MEVSSTDPRKGRLGPMDVSSKSEVKARIRFIASMQMAQRRSVAGVGVVLLMVLMAMPCFHPAMAVSDSVESKLSSTLVPLPILPDVASFEF